MTSWHLILAVFSLLLGFGLLMVLSASSISSYRSSGGSPFSTFANQAVFALLGLCAFVFFARVAPRLVRRFSFPAVLVSLLLLATVLAIGKMTHGARSWIKFSGISFQPSELAKLALLIWMAHVLAARRHELRSLKALLIPVLPVFVLMVGLIMLQPDLGTTISLGIVFFAVLWFAGAPVWIFGGLAVAGLAGAAYLAQSESYRTARVLAFLHPDDPAYAAWTYQLNQGLFGMGHGGIFGAGLGQSMAKWGALPNADSDFIFAIVGEELGLIGTVLVLVLFGLLAYTGLRIARRNVDPFVKIVAASATVWLVGQAAINIGYVVGLLPVTGIPLPLISAGGTSLVISMIVFGLLANFARHEPAAAAALYTQGPGRLARFLGVGHRSAAGRARVQRRTAQREKRRAARVTARAERARAEQTRPSRPAGRPAPRPDGPGRVVRPNRAGTSIDASTRPAAPAGRGPAGRGVAGSTGREVGSRAAGGRRAGDRADRAGTGSTPVRARGAAPAASTPVRARGAAPAGSDRSGRVVRPAPAAGRPVRSGPGSGARPLPPDRPERTTRG